MISTKLMLVFLMLTLVYGLSLAYGEETMVVDKTFNGR